MTSMSLMWFIAIALELSIYRKTTTCNDINVKVQSFSCFEVNNNYQKIDCGNTDDIDTRSVICYLYNPTLAGFAVAFSAATLVRTIADWFFKLVMKATNCIAWCGLALRMVLLLLAVLILAAYIALTQVQIIEESYFIFGEVPMRIAQLVLLCLTVAGMLLIPPWCKHSDDEYKKTYHYLGYEHVKET